jgi:antitoxin (DNA-binding transcriptional repressor) of toxin-antitoxin stability system
MKKLSAREFQHGFAKTADSLKPGESVTVTKRGRPLGIFTKLPARRIKMPDFAANLAATGVSVAMGNQILQEFNDSLS